MFKKLLLFSVLYLVASNAVIPSLSPTSQKASLYFINTKASTTDLCSLNEAFIAMIADAFAPDNFFETGTYIGNTTKIAARHYKNVYSIELAEALYKIAKERFKNQKNIFLFHGDSAVLFPAILPQLNGKTTFFLDAHFCGGASAKSDVNTPILMELEHIRKSGIKNGIILVDDIRFFYVPTNNVTNTSLEGYPPLDSIVSYLMDSNPTYKVACIFDTLVAYPGEENITISPTVHALTVSRFYDGHNFSLQEIMEADLMISRAPTNEADTIETLAKLFIAQSEKASGVARHYALWYGLLLHGKKEYNLAYHYYKEAQERGIIHPCLYFYMQKAQQGESL